MSSIQANAKQISDYLQKETAAARVCGPFVDKAVPCKLHISPIGIIPKPHKPNQWRLIVDMLSPEGASINNTISRELSTLAYMNIRDVARAILAMGKGTKLTSRVPTESCQFTPRTGHSWE